MLELPGVDYDPLPAKPAAPPAKPDVPRTPRSTDDAPPAARTRTRTHRYAIGDVGPGAGIVFYDAGKEQSWGRFLEAAPARWNGERKDPLVPWCWWDDVYADIPDARGKDYGDGRANTAAIIKAGSSSLAGTMAHSYAGGHKTDWFLPSKLELNALYKERTIVGGFTEDFYWSSSQVNKRVAWYQSFAGEGFKKSGETSRQMRIRPVRAF